MDPTPRVASSILASPFPEPYFKLQLPVASSRQARQRGFPSSLLGEEPRPWERLCRLPGALRPPRPCHVMHPRQLARRKWRRAVAKGGEAAGGGPEGGGAGPGSPAAWQRRCRPDPKVGERLRLACLPAGCCGDP